MYPILCRPIEEIEKKAEWDEKFAFENLSTIESPGGGGSGGGRESSGYIKQKCIADDPISFLSEDDLNLWLLEDIAKAGKLLHKPRMTVEFADEQEMRRIFSLIYDVFRCK